MVLPYTEQNNLYQQVREAGTLTNAVNRGILPKVLPFARCPSDGWDLGNGNLCNYVGSSGPQCNNTPSGNCDTPIFQRYCNGENQNQSGPHVHGFRKRDIQAVLFPAPGKGVTEPRRHNAPASTRSASPLTAPAPA